MKINPINQRPNKRLERSKDRRKQNKKKNYVRIRRTLDWWRNVDCAFRMNKSERITSFQMVIILSCSSLRDVKLTINLRILWSLLAFLDYTHRTCKLYLRTWRRSMARDQKFHEMLDLHARFLELRSSFLRECIQIWPTTSLCVKLCWNPLPKAKRRQIRNVFQIRYGWSWWILVHS